MKYSVFLMIFLFSAFSFSMNGFVDVPKEHWAYKSLETLVSVGVINGYPDGSFKGSKILTRNEIALILSKIIAGNNINNLNFQGKNHVEKLISEFSEDLYKIGVRSAHLQNEILNLSNDVSILKKSSVFSGYETGFFSKLKLSGKIVSGMWNLKHERDTVVPTLNNDRTRLGINFDRKNDFEAYTLIYLNAHMDINDDVSAYFLLLPFGFWGTNEDHEHIPFNSMHALSVNRMQQDNPALFYFGYIDVKDMFGIGDFRFGRQPVKIGHSLVYALPTDGITMNKKIDKVNLKLMAWDQNVREWLSAFQNVDYNPAGSMSTNNNDTIYSIPGAFVMTPKNGFNSAFASVSGKINEHNIEFYHLSQSFDNYDPYAKMGDPYAVKWINNTAITSDDNSTNAGSLAPPADPSWTGLSMDGSVMDNLDYYMEFILYDPDIAPYRGDELAGANAGEPVLGGAIRDFNNNSIDNGKAWLLGLDWDITKKMNLIFQYGEGDEEFAPSIVKSNWRLNDMLGRFNVQTSRELYYTFAPTGSLQGVKDMLLKMKYDFSTVTQGYLSYEKCRENDTNDMRHVVATDGKIYSNNVANAIYMNPSDYSAWGLGVIHKYTKNLEFGLHFFDIGYDQDTWIYDANNNGNIEDTEITDINISPNAGGWNALKFEMTAKF